MKQVHQIISFRLLFINIIIVCLAIVRYTFRGLLDSYYTIVPSYQYILSQIFLKLIKLYK